ncbi:MAG: hypothetical protein A2268_04920 [Candidatus Raymondbacteria bacterium RifOxyA12_full_50_37]|uniref:FHA domain-containing protein n=1 Tax=Candidatus Raymondbacteria bacterium RIFOXYD12_FULL_49_13 TaxID=1817890 RepID=A0A1F7FDS3_UNCRA|nr:MAG: hypothetical protein A2268_04920 [Candidatus Raymondbacteria bacterium RifOxyA12_full_50_37]OGJ94086.1 MAG: hypothetical protein A2248_12125 [Candidatus Raymondbacteria bacterium RIFOXYA2_FULL_49_16]OGJ96841.1 MAG: hypothetical protein A2487_07215 [Candidatus Raymondbacteria bacterium RifOxyC12_full_50_8]OGJ96911.1 MAG: hypothetical protein A2453_04725 [Candidatus Raymondbacteria bacterium RIFOXYC2_FULL_50_21]OGK03013.1 MAG: hypothetical protein A2350_03590 [Candidatus Raymondbacteria b
MTVYTLVPTDSAAGMVPTALEKAETVVGRWAPDSLPDIEISGPGISRRHLVLKRDNDRLFAVNPGSRDIRINGEPLSGERQLHGGERIDLLDLSFDVKKGATAVSRRHFVFIFLCLLAVGACLYISRQTANTAGSTALPPVEAAYGTHASSYVETDGHSLAYATILLRDREIHPANRFLACAEFKKAAQSGVPDSVRVYFENTAHRLEAEIDSLYHEYRDLADISFRQKQYGTSRRYLNGIMRMIPDVRDARYIWAATTHSRISGK